MPRPIRPSPPEPANPGRLTVDSVIALYLRHAEAVGQHCAEAAAERVRTLSAFAVAFGALLLAECRPFHLSDWIEGNPRWKSSSTKKAKANQVAAAFNWAVRGGRIDRNPFSGVRYEEAEPRGCMADYVVDEIMRIGNKRWERAVRFLRLTGCRLSDLCRTTWPDVVHEKRIIQLQKHKSRRKTGRPKVIVLVDEAVAILEEIRREQPPGYFGHVFLNNRNKPWNRGTLGQQLRRMKARGQITSSATLHGIRHQWSYTALRNGAPIKMVSLGLSHASVQITERYYGHLEGEIEAVREAAKAANRR